MKIKPIIIGNLVDVVGTMLASVVLAIAGAVMMNSTGEGSDMSMFAKQLVPTGNETRPFLFAVGMGFSILGGFVSARMAKEREILYGGLSTALCVAMGAVAIVKAGDFGIKMIGSEFLTISLGVLGGFIQLRLKPAEAKPEGAR